MNLTYFSPTPFNNTYLCYKTVSLSPQPKMPLSSKILDNKINKPIYSTHTHENTPHMRSWPSYTTDLSNPINPINQTSLSYFPLP